MFSTGDTIAAPATSYGGALSIIRVSGPKAICACDACFVSAGGKKLVDQRGYTLHFGEIRSAEGDFIDQVMVSVFRGPSSYTGEDMVEISCHGSRWIAERIINALTRNGVRMATAGEFTARAFLAGKIDLAQAEAVADIISAENKASHDIAATQLKGSYSESIAMLRDRLLHLISLLELELDFSEEDVTFADRSELLALLNTLRDEIVRLMKTFEFGNAVKEGITVAIVGAPNVGKSTFMNRMVGEDRAMVSDIAGTTRDSIEEVVTIDGVGYRFIDTAGLHESEDILECKGMERTLRVIEKARIVIYMTEPERIGFLREELRELEPKIRGELLVVINKSDKGEVFRGDIGDIGYPVVEISAKTGSNIEAIEDVLTGYVERERVGNSVIIMSNSRHYESMSKGMESLESAERGIESGLSTDLIAEELRMVMNYMGEITGDITNDEVLGQIFSKFCIGK